MQETGGLGAAQSAGKAVGQAAVATGSAVESAAVSTGQAVAHAAEAVGTYADQRAGQVTALALTGNWVDQQQASFTALANSANVGANAGEAEFLYKLSLPITYLTGQEFQDLEKARADYWQESGLEGTIWQAGSQWAADVGAVSTYAWGVVAGAGLSGLSAVGEQVLSQVPQYLYMEAWFTARTGGALTYTQIMANSETTTVAEDIAAADTAVKDPLDWSIVKKSTGETRWDHIQLHGANDLSKPLQGVFDNDPVLTTQQAWQQVQLQGINPVLENGADVYTVPMGGRVGFQGGANGSGAALTNVQIVTQPGTTKIITAYPQ